MDRPRRHSPDAARAAGVDVGATLAKLVLRRAGGEAIAESLPAAALDALAARLRALGVARVALTGGGAARLTDRLDGTPCVRVAEFDAWAEGARALLARDAVAAERFLLVSVGTGTSALLVEPGAATRVGGSALGGGTVVGLGAALAGLRDYDEIVRAAERGDRGRVDLRVADVYPHGDLPLPGDLNASSFAKLARAGAPAPEPADLAHAVLGLVGENVGLICAGLALRAGVERVVFGGSTLVASPALHAILGTLCVAHGLSPHFLPDGQYAGAWGALALGQADIVTR